MLLQRNLSGQYFRSSIEFILKEADTALQEKRMDEVSSLVEIVYAIYDNDVDRVE